MTLGDEMNSWRHNYDLLTYKQQQEFGSDLWKRYPNQSYFNLKAIRSYLSDINESMMVFEFGGWDGDLANKMLSENLRIKLWHNYDIVPELKEHTVCYDERYNCIIPNDFVWKTTISDEFNMFISTHAIEHIKLSNFKELAEKVISRCDWAILDIPLKGNGINWDGTGSSHIFEGGWSDVKEIMEKYKFKIIKIDQWKPPNTAEVSTVVLFKKEGVLG